MSNIIFHIGYHKTGTSFIQKNIFENLSNQIHRVPQREIYESLIYPDPLEYSNKQAKALIEKHVDFARIKNLIPVFSNERLSGGIHSGGCDSVEIAHRIKRCVPDAKIIIGIREQKDIIYSAYNQYIKGGGGASLKEYIMPSTKRNKYLFHISFLEYHRLIELYYSLFSPDNVLVIPYEILKYNPREFIQKILLFMNCGELFKVLDNDSYFKINESLKPASLSVRRFLNPFILKEHPYFGNSYYSIVMVWLLKSIDFIVKISSSTSKNERLTANQKARIEEIIKHRYTLSNQKTSDLIGINLHELGYFFD